jgi:hypothetical protein
MNVFDMFEFSWKRPIKSIKYFFKALKWSRQRVKQGYCDWDVGDIHVWFARVMSKMIRDLKENYIGHPQDRDLYNECYDAYADELDMSRDEFLALTPHIDDKHFEWCAARWKEKLEEMAVAFDTLEKAIYDGEYDKRDELKENALSLFNKYYFYLWH